MQAKTVKDVMTHTPECVEPGATIQEVAQKMEKINAGTILICKNDRLAGVITDRDIALRVVAKGKNPKTTTVEEAMTEGVVYCYEDESLEKVADKMADNNVLRLIVLNHEKRMTGIVTHSDLADATEDAALKTKITQIASKHAA